MPLVDRLVRFGLVGGFGVLVNLGLLALLVEVLGLHPLLASVFSIEASTVTNFFINRAWTWRDRRTSLWSLLSYHGVALVGLIAQYAVLAVTLHFFQIHYLIAALLGIAAGTAWNFLANHHFTFKEWHATRIAHHRRVLLYLVSFVLQAILAALLIHDWDIFVFQTSVEQFLRDGTTPYEVGVEKPAYVYWGTFTPSEAWWYAYPPVPLLLMSLTYAPAIAFSLPAWVGRILIKLPVLVANLAFAAIAHRMLRSAPDAVRNPQRQADLVERFLLFNPLIILVAAIRGQFELILLCFLALSFLCLREKKWATGGLFWGAACLVKIFPLYIGPMLLIYLVRRAGFTSAFRYFFVGGFVFALGSLPFYLLQPHGYIEQVFLMHGNRQPGGFAAIAFLYHTLRGASRRFPGLLPDDVGLSQTLSTLSFTLTVVMIGLMTLAASRDRLNERSLLLWSALTVSAGILVTKVVSEQYCLLSLALFTLYLYHPQAPNANVNSLHVRTYAYLLTTFACLVAFNDSVFFLVFLPADVANALLPTSVPETILAISSSLGLTVNQFRTLLGAFTGLGLLFPFIALVRVLRPHLAAGVHELGRLLQGKPIPSVRVSRFLVAGILVMLLLPAVAMGAVAPKREAIPPAAGAVSSGPLVLVHYRPDWFNPVIRPDVPGGPWATARYSPVGGYYTSVSYKITQDLQQLRAAQVDAVVIAFHPAFEAGTAAVAAIADDLQVPHALEVDLLNLADAPTGRVPLTQDTSEAARELFDGPKFAFWSDGYHLRLAPDRPRLLLVAGASELGYTFTDAERRHVADHLESSLDRAQVREIQEPGKPLWQSAPQSRAELEAATPNAALWRNAYESARIQWWTRAFSFLNPESQDAGLELVVDAPPGVDLASLAPLHVVGTYTPLRSATRASNQTLFATIPADPTQPEAFRERWTDARADGRPLLVSWNDFDLGYGIEPTIEFGTNLLDVVRDRSEPAGST